MSRRFNWLSAYAEYTSESESPDSWHFWMGLSVLSSAARRNVWIDQGIYTLYPNMYVVLVGPPGLGKSTSIRLGRRLLLRLEDVMFGPDSLTREELIQVMAKSGGQDKQSAVTLHSTELSSLIEPSGVMMVQFLIDIYDSDDIWKYSTKNSGRNVIHKPFLNIVAGTVPSYLADNFPVPIIGNGFTARTIFVYEGEPRFPNPFPKGADPALVDALVDDLHVIASLKGPFQWSPEAKELYEKQYKKIFDTSAEDYRLEDFHKRKKIHLLKVAMMLSMAERDDLMLYPQDLDTAWELLLQLERTMPKTFSAVGKYEYASDFERIVAQVYASGGMTVTDIYNRNRSVGDADTLGRILILAEKSGQIKRSKDEEGTIWYRPVAS